MNGKGDKNRVTDHRRFRLNHDEINWQSRAKERKEAEKAKERRKKHG